MSELWILIYFCTAVSMCDPSGNTLGKTYSTESDCQKAGLKTLQDAPKGMQGKVVVCLKGIR